jgi:hypothetical protein
MKGEVKKHVGWFSLVINRHGNVFILMDMTPVAKAD